MISKYPIGLHAKTKFFRCCITTWNNDTREWILTRMKVTPANIKPVFVIQNDESVKMYIPNDDLTNLIETVPTGEEIIWKIKNKRLAHWHKVRTEIQKKNIPMRRKEILSELLNRQELDHETLEPREKLEIEALN